MTMRIALPWLMTVGWLMLQGGTDFSGEGHLDVPASYLADVPIATSVADAHAYFPLRAEALLRHVASTPLEQLQFNLEHKFTFAPVIISKLMLGDEVEAINGLLLNDDVVRPFGRPGTHFRSFPCIRNGDYDFAMVGLIHIAYHFDDRPDLLWPETRNRIIDDLIIVNGNRQTTRLPLRCGLFRESENHILMTEAVRYLQNQILHNRHIQDDNYDDRFDNELNGFNDWWMFHLQQFLANDFFEFNSRPYQGHSVTALQLLYEYSFDDRVKLGSQLVLDYISARTAIQLNGLRRASPFRRKGTNRHVSDLIDGGSEDHEVDRFIMYAGNFHTLKDLDPPFSPRNHTELAVYSAIGTYRIPDLILDLSINKRDNIYFQIFKHDGLEAYYSSPNFLLTFGGIHIPTRGVKSMFDRGELNGQVLPTTIMPSQEGLDWKRFVRLEGPRLQRKQTGMCIAEGFACGFNPIVPDNIPNQCIYRHDPWTFINFTTPCPLDYGFYIAVYESETIDRRLGSNDRFGLIEVREFIDNYSFYDFIHNIIEYNEISYFGSDRSYVYVTSFGVDIEFDLSDSSENQIRRIDSTTLAPVFSSSLLARGTVMNASGNGRVEVRSPSREEVLILDYSAPHSPERRILSLSTDH